ncbi:MAG: CDP-alcohol phosphatidyltransferase family protein, partial [Promethearchaeia archaeon]
NTLTILGLIFGLLSALSIFLSKVGPETFMIILALILMVISFLLDSFDGAIAHHEGGTVFGGILDMFCDRSVEVAIIISIISTDAIQLMWSGIFTLSSIILCITIFLVIASAVTQVQLEQQENYEKLLYYSSGIIERSETFIFLFLITLIIALRALIMWIFAALIFITTVQRFYSAYRLFYSHEKEEYKQ